MLQQDDPDDYVIATGESHSVREFLEEAFGYAGLDWNEHVQTDPRYFRPIEVEHLQGNPAKAMERLGWRPRVKFRELVRMMVDADLKDLEELRYCQDVIRKLSGNRHGTEGGEKGGKL